MQVYASLGKFTQDYASLCQFTQIYISLQKFVQACLVLSCFVKIIVPETVIAVVFDPCILLELKWAVRPLGKCFLGYFFGGYNSEYKLLIYSKAMFWVAPKSVHLYGGHCHGYIMALAWEMRWHPHPYIKKPFFCWLAINRLTSLLVKLGKWHFTSARWRSCIMRRV